MDNVKCCDNCANYEKEWEYCFRYGNHAPKDESCDRWKEKVEPKKG
jgi:hypothetical protein